MGIKDLTDIQNLTGIVIRILEELHGRIRAVIDIEEGGTVLILLSFLAKEIELVPANAVLVLVQLIENMIVILFQRLVNLVLGLELDASSITEIHIGDTPEEFLEPFGTDEFVTLIGSIFLPVIVTEVIQSRTLVVQGRTLALVHRFLLSVYFDYREMHGLFLVKNRPCNRQFAYQRYRDECENSSRLHQFLTMMMWLSP